MFGDPIEMCHKASVRSARSEAQTELSKLPKTEDEINELSADQLIQYRAEVEEIFNSVQSAERNLEYYQKRQKELGEHLKGGKVIFSGKSSNNANESEIQRMDDNKEMQVRSLQKYLTSEYRQLNDLEQRSLELVGAAAVVPTQIMNKLITEGKYSTLLARATVFNDGKPGKLSIPIASNNAAVWKDENSNVDSSDASYEKSPTLTNIVLGGHELYRWMRMSAAAYSMSSSEFEGMMLNLLASEVVEELEKTFVDGTGVGQPTGLKELSFTKDVNAIEVANGTAIAPKDIADAIALLSAKYARNSIVMCNTGTLADIALFKGTSEFAYNLSDGASKFLGHEIVVNEHIADDVIYVVDPKELYVRFAMPVQVEANNSSGFTSASVDLRALTVVDAAWNPQAVAKVYIKAIA